MFSDWCSVNQAHTQYITYTDKNVEWHRTQIYEVYRHWNLNPVS